MEGEVLKSANLVKVVLDFLDDSGRSILAQVVHRVQSFENATPFLWLALDFAPEVLHDDVVVFPVVGVVGEHLKLAVGDVPVLV